MCLFVWIDWVEEVKITKKALKAGDASGWCFQISCFDLFCFSFKSNLHTNTVSREPEAAWNRWVWKGRSRWLREPWDWHRFVLLGVATKMPRMIRFGRRWTQRNQIGSWRRTDWLLRCGIGSTSLLDSCEYLEIYQIFLRHFESSWGQHESHGSKSWSIFEAFLKFTSLNPVLESDSSQLTGDAK